MGPRNLPQEQPQQLFTDAAQDAQTQKAQAELEATVLRFWDTVRKSADVIVTLRQENAILQAQVQSLRKSETDLQGRVEDFLGRIADLETLHKTPATDSKTTAAVSSTPVAVSSTQVAASSNASSTMAETEDLIIKAHEAEVRGLRTNIDRLEDELNRLQNELNEAQAQLGDHKIISMQLTLVRSELEARTALLQELQVNLEEQRSQRLLDQRQQDQRQLDIFGTVAQRGMAPAEMLALASRLDALSGRISSLFGIS